MSSRRVASFLFLIVVGAPFAACGGDAFTEADGSAGAAGASAGAGAGGEGGGAAGTGPGGSGGATGGSGGTGGATAGSAGKGGASGASGSGGSGGTAAKCSTPSDCPKPASACLAAFCVGGLCGTVATNEGNAVPASAQVTGDCQKLVCENGNAVPQPDDTDVPKQGSNPCLLPVCQGGKTSTKAAPADTPCNGGKGTCATAGVCTSCMPGEKTCKGDTPQTCSASGVFMDDAPCSGATPRCEGSGVCVACVAATDCPASTDDCKQAACVQSKCTLAPKASGTKIPKQSPGDCKDAVCDGKGSVTSAVNAADVPPDDQDPCTLDTCSAAGVPYPPAPQGTTCGASVCDGKGDCGMCQPGAKLCSGASAVKTCNGNGTFDPPVACAGSTPFCAGGACVECTDATQCAVPSNPCLDRACNANKCGTTPRAAGYKIATQVVGDCQDVVCDGNGAQTSQATDQDPPPDDFNPCTQNTCAGGKPYPPESINTPCGSRAVCDGASHCGCLPGTLAYSGPLGAGCVSLAGAFETQRPSDMSGGIQCDLQVDTPGSCTVSNPFTGACSCPSGFVVDRYRVLTENAGGACGVISVCRAPTVGAVSDYGGGYLQQSVGSGPVTCTVKNGYTSQCSCPANFASITLPVKGWPTFGTNGSLTLCGAPSQPSRTFFGAYEGFVSAVTLSDLSSKCGAPNPEGNQCQCPGGTTTIGLHAEDVGCLEVKSNTCSTQGPAETALGMCVKGPS